MLATANRPFYQLVIIVSLIVCIYNLIMQDYFIAGLFFIELIGSWYFYYINSNLEKELLNFVEY